MGAPQQQFATDPEARETSFAKSIDSPRLAELYAYWAAKRRERFAPARADIDPIDIPRLLPHLMLIDVVDGGARFRYRLAGTEIESRFGCSMVGRYIDEMMRGRYSDYIHDLYRELIATRRPLYSESAYGRHEDSPLYTQRLMLPLSNGGADVEMVLAGQVFTYRSAASRETVVTIQDDFNARMIAAGGA